MRNEEWFNFFTEFKTFVAQSTSEALDIETLFLTFLALYEQADKALEVLRKSSYTSEIVRLDGVRDVTCRGLKETVKSALHHYLAPMCEAAEKLEVILDHYGNLSTKPYNEETSGIYNLLQDLRAKTAEVATLNLSGWLDELEANNQAFEAAILARNAESADHIADLNVLKIRRQTNRCYLDIVERLEALMLIQGDAAFADFVNKLNANIERYKNALSRRVYHKEEKTD
jgi:flagellar biosynthesis chaperone FliJ